MKKITLIVVFISLLIACNPANDKKVLKEANGRINSLLVVIKTVNGKEI